VFALFLLYSVADARDDHEPTLFAGGLNPGAIVHQDAIKGVHDLTSHNALGKKRE
jgi:hypothetical protein